jgi:hypothetical protein
MPGLAAVLAARDREACEPALDALRNLASGRHDVKAALVAQGAAPALVAAARGLPGDLRAAALAGEAQTCAGAGDAPWSITAWRMCCTTAPGHLH